MSRAGVADALRFSSVRSFLTRPVLCALVLFLHGCQEAQETDPPAATASRIVSLAPHVTELVYAAGAGDRLVGVVEYSDYPAEAQELPLIGDAFRLDYEAVAQLQPDLVLAWQSGTPRETRDRLRSLGYRVVELEPASLEDIVRELRAVGRLAVARHVHG